jgi:hypothetical protein
MLRIPFQIPSSQCHGMGIIHLRVVLTEEAAVAEFCTAR